MIKLLEAKYLGDFQIELSFSDGTFGVIDMGDYCARRQGPLLDALHAEAYLKRFIIEAGALGWPNGLELSPNRLYELCQRAAAA